MRSKIFEYKFDIEIDNEITPQTWKENYLNLIF